jgi:hypothetical protein
MQCGAGRSRRAPAERAGTDAAHAAFVEETLSTVNVRIEVDPRYGDGVSDVFAEGASAVARVHVTRTHFNREERYSLGVVDSTGEPCLYIPVTIGVADYNEYYALTPETYERFVADSSAAAAFAEECRRREHDDLLLQQPGWNRGTPI